MCGRLVNIDTVARVLAEYYHLKTDTQLAALDEALSRVPAVSVVGGYRKDHVVDPNKMVGDSISRAAAIEAIKEDKIDLTDPNVVAVFKATGDFEKVETQVMTCDRHIKILKGLPSAPSEQTDCEYCHEDSDGYVRSIEKNSHAWLVRRGRTMKLRVGFNGGHSECDILFCPMCGRRLTDG